MSAVPSVLTARPATVEDLEEVADLLRRVFGVQRSAADLRWKFTGSAGRLLGSTVLMGDSGIVGFIGQIPARVRVAGREVMAAQGVDVGILEAHRRLDAFLTMLQVCVAELEAAGVALAYGTANAEAALSLGTLLGQETVAPVPLLVRPIGGKSGRSASTPARLLAACVRVADHCATPGSASVHAGLRVARLTRFDNRFDRFWRRIRDDYPIMLVRDAAYLNWRYVDAPGVTYERLGLEDVASGEIEGYAVLRTTLRGDRIRGRICDLVTPRQGHRRAARTLIAASVAWFRGQEATVADAWMFPHTHLRFALRRNGFLPRRPRQGGFQAVALATDKTPRLTGLERASNWFLSLGDSDTV